MAQSSEDALERAANKVKTVTLHVLRKSGENEEPHKQRQLQVCLRPPFCVALLVRLERLRRSNVSLSPFVDSF
jgi:predicted naringenin-chalcone synthase